MIPDIDRPLRILNVNQNYHVLGGMDVAMFQLEAILTAYGHHVVPFAAADPANRPTDYARYFPPAPPTTDTAARDLLRTLYSPTARRAIGRILDEQAIDLVHLHSYFKRLTPSILPEIRRRNIPIVQTMHEYRAVCPTSLLYRDGHVCTDCHDRRYGQAVRHRCAGGSLARSLWNVAEMRLSDALGHKRDIARYLSISTYQRDQLIAMGMAADRIETIYHPVALPPAPLDAPDRDIVLFAGRVEPHKGIFTLIEAARRLPDISFAIAGDGAARADAVAQAADLGNIEWLGVLDAKGLAAQRERALCAVVPSLYPEPFGLTSIEALAHGVPVIASAIGGLAETVRNGIDGYLVPPGDVDAMTDRISLLASTPDLARRMGVAGSARAADEFSSERHYQRTMAVYRQALSEHAVVSAPRKVAA
jgi:glycosyltransferase involved in cell wall biosynthesis